MAATSFVAVRVSPEMKAYARALAARLQLTELALLKRLIDNSIQTAGLDTGNMSNPIDLHETRRYSALSGNGLLRNC